MSRRILPRRLTLVGFLLFGFAALAAVLVALLSIFTAGSRRTLLEASERLMAQASRRIAERVDGHLGEAERLIAALESELALGVARLDAPHTVDAALVGGLAAHPHVTEATLTWARAEGEYEADGGTHEAGDLRFAAEGRGQTSAVRESGGRIVVRRIVPAAGGWSAAARALDGSTVDPGPPPPDPTLHPTFTVASRPRFRGRAIWSDLSYAEADAALPEAERRRVVSAQKALRAADGTFLGVARVAILSDAIDELVRVRVDERWAGADDHVVFLCDREGRLLSRFRPSDRFALLDENGRPDEEGDVRVVLDGAPLAVRAALRWAADANVPARGAAETRLAVDGVPYLASVATLLGDRTQDWLLAIVVPESHYLRDLESSRRRVLFWAALLMLASVAGAAVVLATVRRDLGRHLRELRRLRAFDFAPSEGPGAAFRDVSEAAESLEQAKTALRALGKYVPLDLVRELWEARMEPMLGGRLQDVTLLFSDIEGFTSISERLSPNALATALGAYLEAMTRAIHATGGVIDKYTGDGVMALWNAPRPCERHPARACEAALACVAAADALFASDAWDGLEPWRTRFGIHRAEVTVGHFGAPDRMSFTALGDGVNLASRLEGLNKQYGTRILVSAAVEREARSEFRFRRIDRVAVKGKRDGVEVLELLGRAADGERPAFVERYERALDRYFARDFGAALDALAGADDPSSRVLAARCERLLADPPPPDWDGIWVAREK